MCYMSEATRVGVRELRQNLSVYLRRVQAGERFDVTEHGSLVGRLLPPATGVAWLDQLVALGAATPALKRDGLRRVSRPAPLPKGATPISAALAEQRSERLD
jgi:antitoxin (DNA-binding transcriptional repressor) of toxin-antitoxin stability system